MNPNKMLYDAVIALAHGASVEWFPEPGRPSEVQKLLLQAIDAFRNGRQCRGWDLVEEAEKLEEEENKCLG